MKTKTAIQMREARKRNALLEEARALCLDHGLSGLSLDRLIANTGVSKRTLYRYFHSRTAFVADVVAHDGAIWREWFLDAIREQADTPGQRLYAFFDTLALWTASPDFRGCLFAQALCNGAPLAEEITRAAQKQMEYVRKFLHDNARRAGVKNPTAFAEALLLSVTVVLSGTGCRVSENSGKYLAALAGALLQHNHIHRNKP